MNRKSQWLATGAMVAAIFAAPALVSAQETAGPRPERRATESPEGARTANPEREGRRGSGGPAVEQQETERRGVRGARGGQPPAPEVQSGRGERRRLAASGEGVEPEAANAEKALIDTLMNVERDRAAVEQAVRRLREAVIQEARGRIQQRIEAAQGGPAAARPSGPQRSIEGQTPRTDGSAERARRGPEAGAGGQESRGQRRAMPERDHAGIGPQAGGRGQRFAPPMGRAGFNQGQSRGLGRALTMRDRQGALGRLGQGIHSRRGLGANLGIGRGLGRPGTAQGLFQGRGRAGGIGAAISGSLRGRAMQQPFFQRGAFDGRQGAMQGRSTEDRAFRGERVEQSGPRGQGPDTARPELGRRGAGPAAGPAAGPGAGRPPRPEYDEDDD